MPAFISFCLGCLIYLDIYLLKVILVNRYKYTVKSIRKRESFLDKFMNESIVRQDIRPDLESIIACGQG